MTYAGGGAGGSDSFTSAGGAGGGGAQSTPGTVNTGGGGGGGNLYNYSSGLGDGGSGVVILKYADTSADLTTIAGGLTYTLTTSGGFKVYRFTAGTGTVTI